MPIELSTLLTILLSGTNAAQFFIIWKTRKSEVKKAQAGVLENIEGLYVKLVENTNLKFEEMQAEIKTLKSQLADYERKCKLCQK